MLALAGLAAWMKLGGATIESEAEAIAAAEADIAGFRGVRATVDRGGQAALVEGADGSFVVLKVTGARIASRQLAEAPVREGEAMVARTGDRWFGDVRVQG